MSYGFGDYDRWKLTEYDGPTCDRCGEFLRRAWPPNLGWCCDACDEESEYRERQMDEQLEREG